MRYSVNYEKTVNEKTTDSTARENWRTDLSVGPLWNHKIAGKLPLSVKSSLPSYVEQSLRTG